MDLSILPLVPQEHSTPAPQGKQTVKLRDIFSFFSCLILLQKRIFQICLSDLYTIEHLSFTYAITFTFTCSTGKVGHFNLSSSFVRFKCSFHFFLNEYDFGMNQSNISQYLFFFRDFTLPQVESIKMALQFSIYTTLKAFAIFFDAQIRSVQDVHHFLLDCLLFA